jgi:WD40 repeat protein
VTDPVSHAPVARFTPGVAGTVEALAFSADGRSIVVAVVKRATAPSSSKEKNSFVTDFEARFVVHSLDTGREESSSPFVASGILGTPMVDRGGRCFCAVTFGDTTSLYAARPGPSPVERVWSGNGLVVISPDGFRLAGRGEGNVVIVREVGSGQVVANWRGHSGPVRALVFSTDGLRLASTSDDRTIRVWELGQEKATAVLRGQANPVDRLAFSADGTRLVSASAVDVVVWDPSTTSEARVARIPERHHLADLAAAPGGRAAVVAGHRLSWRDTATGLPSGGVEVADVDAVASAPRGGWTAAGIGDGSIVLLDSEGKAARTLRGHEAAIARLSFNADGSRLASASRDGIVRVWETVAGREIAWFEAGPHRRSQPGRRISGLGGRRQRGHLRRGVGSAPAATGRVRRPGSRPGIQPRRHADRRRPTGRPRPAAERRGRPGGL